MRKGMDEFSDSCLTKLGHHPSDFGIVQQSLDMIHDRSDELLTDLRNALLLVVRPNIRQITISGIGERYLHLLDA